VAGDFSPQEREEFEMLLAEDQSAREAVAAAVALCDTLSTFYSRESDQAASGTEQPGLKPSEPRRHTARRKRLVVGLAWAAAASLVLLALGRLLLAPADKADSLDDLAHAWSSALEQRPVAAWPLPEAVPPDAVEHDPFQDDVADLETDAGESPGVPAWMLAGLTALSEGETVEGEPEL